MLLDFNFVRKIASTRENIIFDCWLALERKCARAFCLSLSFSPKPPRRKSADTEDTESTFQLSEMTKFQKEMSV